MSFVPLEKTPELNEVLQKMIEAARQAGDLALLSFHTGGPTSANVTFKDNSSPVTSADYAVNDFLRAVLCSAFPGTGWLSEESPEDGERLSQKAIFIIDPIDGTRGYVAGNSRWVISIAYVVEHRPLAAVVYAPALNEMYSAQINLGAFCNDWPIHVSQRQEFQGSLMLASRKFIEKFASSYTSFFTEGKRAPSLAYSLVDVARGLVDLMAIETNAHDWDIAAVDLLIQEAGGKMTNLEGKDLHYNRPSLRHKFLLAGTPSVYHKFLALPSLQVPSKTM